MASPSACLAVPPWLPPFCSPAARDFAVLYPESCAGRSVAWESVLNAAWRWMASPTCEVAICCAAKAWRSRSVSERREFDVLVVGGGPAGIAAACCAAEAALRVAIADDNPALGGQIWRGEHASPSTKEATFWYQRVKDLGGEHLPGTRVFAQTDSHSLLAETDTGVCELIFRSLILATGARERFLPFPGWTLPNVMGAGGLQAMAKSGWNVRGRKVVVAGTGPLLLAVAAHLKQYGADLRLIAEQASWQQLAPFALSLWRQPPKLKDALSLRRQLLGVPYL